MLGTAPSTIARVEILWHSDQQVKYPLHGSPCLAQHDIISQAKDLYLFALEPELFRQVQCLTIA
jgi:hypothetical protein